eukprot:c7772_g1_i2.p1 GENE.c7772_g1_i2~~c7772_g1_i2.p1  ORF type:complete len:514 (-),score=192.95 c7772_g1_i2:77-1618(-)
MKSGDDGQTVEFTDPSSKLPQVRSLTFHSCVQGNMTQENFFPLSGIKSLLSSVLSGLNSTVMAYGQTSSGKTFSMSGPESYLGANHTDEIYDPNNEIPQIIKDICKQMAKEQEKLQGLIPRSIKALFKEIRKRHKLNPSEKYTVKTSYLEIYNEKITCLISGKEGCNIRMSGEGFIVDDAAVEQCNNVKELMALFVNGIHNRTISSTNMNKESSRSHSLLVIYIDFQQAGSTNIRTSKLVLVDLAGSERLKQAHGHEGSAVKRNLSETANINKSLLALSNVVSKLSQGESAINYRDSNLTKLLMDSLGGTCRILLIACVSPAKSFIEESGNTLAFASKAANIVKKVVIKLSPHEIEVQKLNGIIKELKEENENLKRQISQGKFSPATETATITSSPSPQSVSLSQSSSEKPSHHRDASGSFNQIQNENIELRQILWEKVVAVEKVAQQWKNEVIVLRTLLEKNGISYPKATLSGENSESISDEIEEETEKQKAKAKQELIEKIHQKKRAVVPS